MNRLHQPRGFKKGPYRRRYSVPYSFRMRPHAGLLVEEPKKGPYKPNYGPILLRSLDYDRASL